MMITEEQWLQAKEYFDSIFDGYKRLTGIPGVCVDYTIENVLEPLLKQYNDGIRTEELYNNMLNVE